MFQGPLAPKSIAAVRAATRLTNDEVIRAAVAMAADEITAQAEVSAA
jgi:hypothetical protein